MMKLWQVFAIIIACMFIFTGGLIIGKQNASPVIQRETEIKWLPGPEVKVPIEVEKLIPYEVVREVPVPEYITIPADTSAIIADYLLRRKYDFDFSTDTTGTFLAHIEIQANQVVSANATIKALTRVETTTITRLTPPKTQGYAQFGSSLDASTLKLSGGVDIRNKFMVGASGIKINDNWGYTIDVGLKF